MPPTLTTDDKDEVVKTVIDDLGDAERFFSEKCLYDINMYFRDKMETHDHVERYEYMHRLYNYMQEYYQMDYGTIEKWEAKQRENFSQRPYMKDLIAKRTISETSEIMEVNLGLNKLMA